MKKTLKIIGGVFAAFFLLIVIMLIVDISNDEKTEEVSSDQIEQENEEGVTSVEEPQEDVQEEVSIQNSLGYNVEEFTSRFNKTSKELELGYEIKNVNVEDGSVQDVFQYKLTENIVLMGTVNKADKSLRDVSILAQGDGSAQSGMDIMLALASIIATTNPELNADERGEILGDLGLLGASELKDGMDNRTERNGVNYIFQYNEMFGIMFIAEGTKQ